MNGLVSETNLDHLRGWMGRKLCVQDPLTPFPARALAAANQVAVMNEMFAPSAEAVNHARELPVACEKAVNEGRGAFELQGRMIDPPVVARAHEILRRHAAVTRLPTADVIGIS